MEEPLTGALRLGQLSITFVTLLALARSLGARARTNPFHCIYGETAKAMERKDTERESDWLRNRAGEGTGRRGHRCLLHHDFAA